ncbi:MAG: EamA family transporter, partial [Anaerolineales bacterium]|nr:EamA family transporter [Anaerolineales bacterium]
MRPWSVGALLLLGAIWGASFLFIGLAVQAFGPVVMMFLRVTAAGAILAGLARVSGPAEPSAVGLAWRRNWRRYAVVGLLNCALPFTLIAFSELRLTVSLAAVLNSTTPLFTVLIAALSGGQPLAMRTILGVLLGILGVAVLVGAGPLTLTLDLGIAVLASLLAALCYGGATVYAARHLTGLAPIQASVAQLSSAAVLLAIPAMVTLPTSVPSFTAVGALLALIVLSTS